MSKVSETQNNIEKIFNKNGEMLFRMGISYLFGKGTEKVPNIDLDECDKQFHKTEEEILSKGEGIPIMTADFQVDIVRVAKELSEIDLWSLLYYIKANLNIDNR